MRNAAAGRLRGHPLSLRVTCWFAIAITCQMLLFGGHCIAPADRHVGHACALHGLAGCSVHAPQVLQ